MVNVSCRRWLWCLVCVWCAVVTISAQSFPKATGRVNDFANVIDPTTEAAIDQQIDQLEQKTSSEIAVATVKSLDGMSVEEYANKLFKQWGVGQAKDDNGVLVLVAPAEHKIRIEVGYGLEGVLPDGLAGEVIRDTFTPKFKSNDYSGGIKDGVNRLIGIVEKHEQAHTDTVVSMPYWMFIPVFGVFVLIGFTMLGIGIKTKTFIPALFGTLCGSFPLGISMLLTPLPSLFTLVPLAVFSIWAGRRLGGSSLLQKFRDSVTSPGGWSTGTTDSSDSSSSDSDSSSSSSSSSDSDFGGGSSGGGGASGSW